MSKVPTFPQKSKRYPLVYLSALCQHVDMVLDILRVASPCSCSRTGTSYNFLVTGVTFINHLHFNKLYLNLGTVASRKDYLSHKRTIRMFRQITYDPTGVGSHS